MRVRMLLIALSTTLVVEHPAQAAGGTARQASVRYGSPAFGVEGWGGACYSCPTLPTKVDEHFVKVRVLDDHQGTTMGYHHTDPRLHAATSDPRAPFAFLVVGVPAREQDYSSDLARGLACSGGANP